MKVLTAGERRQSGHFVSSHNIPYVRYCHAILRERPGLVGADSRRGAERLHGLEILHQAILPAHFHCCQRQTYLYWKKIQFTVLFHKKTFCLKD